ncbi:lipid IV(A) 3-deoxy-D-manno-octulosonic acid transferase [Marinospirillum sp.]|uniref:lipid IV(A) 3-deoxy-D-manno-octulosonic acid transferase n=1 Tax=Marinospirillum sp. TaxID=2183934 RepID=UPI003A8368E1
MKKSPPARMSLARGLYSGLLCLLTPWAQRRLAKEKVNAFSAYQRRGEVSPSERPVIWAHCASVGEVLAAEPFLKALLLRYPRHQLVVTTMTATGAAQVRARLPDARHYLLPLDLPWYAERFIDTLQPEAGVVFETELWPNLLASCRRRRIPLLLANARLSASAMRGYRKIRPLVKEALSAFSLITAKAEEDAARLLALGAEKDRLQVTGSIKYDLQLPEDLPAQASAWRAALGDRRVWIAASTHQGEDQPLLAAHQQLLAQDPSCLLLLVPRHPQRFDQVAELIAQQGLSSVRRSSQQPVTPETQVYLVDTLGELLFFYAVADLAVVAGSFADIGGHNLLEPAAVGTPVISGPVLHNFAEIAAALTEVDGRIEVDSASALPAVLAGLWADPAACQRQAEAARQVVLANQGALARQLEAFAHLLPPETSEEREAISPCS